MKLLKHKAHFFRAETHQLIFAAMRQVHAVHRRASGRQCIQPAKNID